MMKRRKLLVASSAGVLAASLACFALPPSPKVARIGLLEGASISASRREALIAGLREHGLVEGKNIAIEYRGAEGRYERLPALAAELMRTKVDVIVAASSPAVQAAQRATASIPIVMIRTANPVESGFVASLSRPGGNITGLSSINADVSGKYVELLREAVPGLARIAVLTNPGNATHAQSLRSIQAAAKTNGVEMFSAGASTESEIDAVFGAMKRQRAGALIVPGDPFFFSQTSRIVKLAAGHRLPTLFATRNSVESGGLMSYGQNPEEHYHRAAAYVDKILKGAKPADLPVEQSTKIELVINRKTATVIGLSLPPDLLSRADWVIE